MRSQECATQAIHGLGGARRASCAPPSGSLFACGEFGAAGGAKDNGNGNGNGNGEIESRRAFAGTTGS
ncbi:hypothetical protein LEN_3353 [Lysobacter enzymogenes]|uniref:Lipoprotein n=1 Tax=Lysobacter enzymogenes TaxID=69 RepID=A0AAU9AV16_LYSEN|nr:hypothetical protein LEN_3353 [Lysobacter enzymogenes]